jgi:hypothetical protein
LHSIAIALDLCEAKRAYGVSESTGDREGRFDRSTVCGAPQLQVFSKHGWPMSASHSFLMTPSEACDELDSDWQLIFGLDGN